MIYLVDSDWVIDRLLARPDAVQLLDALLDQGLAISVITYGEVYDGIDGSRDPATAEAAFNRFLKGVTLIDLDAPTLRLFAAIRSQLRRIGRPIGDLDLLIAATAIHHDLTLVTRNQRHFGRVPGLRLYPR